MQKSVVLNFYCGDCKLARLMFLQFSHDHGNRFYYVYITQKNLKLESWNYKNNKHTETDAKYSMLIKECSKRI